MANREPIRMTDFYQSIFTLKRKELSYDYFPFWVDILNSPHLSQRVPQSERKVVWEFSRQVGKSVNIAVIGLGNSIIYDNFTTIITQPTDRQISRFSVDTLKPMNRKSIVTDVFYYDSRNNERQVKNKSFVNGSRIVLANIYASVLGAHGIPASATIFDEAQSTPEENIEEIEQSLRRSEHRYVIYSGNPEDENNHLHRKLLQSKYHEWAVPCPHCRKWNVPLGLKNIGKKGLICRYCKRPINTREGIWVARNRKAYFDGYHANELMIPQDNPAATEWDSLVKEIDQKDAKTVNIQILGLPYSSNTIPITAELIRDLCDGDREYVRHVDEITNAMKYNTVAGLDWALETNPVRKINEIKSYTILTIGQILSDGSIKVLFVKRFLSMQYNNPDDTINEIIRWCYAFNVQIIGMDYGAGHKENQRIIETLGDDRAIEFQYVGRQHDNVVWDADLMKFILNRTSAMDLLVSKFQKHEIRLAKFSGETSEYKNDLTNVYLYHDAVGRHKRYGKTGADDWFHSLVYLLLASMQYLEILLYQIKGEGYD